MSPTPDLRDHVAVVTGASSGLGRRLALDLAAAGATVTAIARREQELSSLAKELRRATGASGYAVCDVADAGDYREVLDRVQQQHGAVDVLVHTAGTERRVATVDADLELYRRTMDTNFFSAVTGTLAVLPGMVERGHGYIVNTSSDQGRAPTPMVSAYSASKAALAAFTEATAYEVRDQGVHLHVLYPGWVPTPLGRSAVDGGMPMPPKVIRKTEHEVSRATLRSLGSGRVEINVARLAAMAPIARTMVPRIYARELAGR